MITVFAGAGASIAVSKKISTTVEFFNNLPEDITSTQIFKQSVKFIKNINGSEIIDIEQLIEHWEHIISFLKKIGDHNTDATINWFFSEFVLSHITKHNQNTRPLINMANEGRQFLENLIDEINKLVYDYYSYAPSRKELEKNWITLLQALNKDYNQIEIVTTNYDMVIERAIDFIMKSNPKFPVDTCKTNTTPSTLDVSEWDKRLMLNNYVESDKGFLTKLHGSVHWRLGNHRKIYISDPFYSGSHDQHVALYFAFKGEAKEWPFNVFHNYLSYVLQNTDAVIFIGYAFRDKYINTILKQYNTPELRKIIINPKMIPELPYESKDVKHIKENFALSSINKCIKELKI